MAQARSLPLRAASALGFWTTSQFFFVGELMHLLGGLVRALPRGLRRFRADVFEAQVRRAGLQGLGPVAGLGLVSGALLLAHILGLPSDRLLGRWVMRLMTVEVGPALVGLVLILHTAPLLAAAVGLQVSDGEDPGAGPTGVGPAASDPRFLAEELLPRVLGVAVSALCLWSIFCVLSLSAASAMAVTLADQSFGVFLHDQLAEVPPRRLLDAMARAVVFGLAVALVAGHEALRTRHPAHLPVVARLAVVRSTFVCLTLAAVSHLDLIASLLQPR